MTSDTTTTTKTTTTTTKTTTKTTTTTVSINGGDDDVDNGVVKDIDDSAMTMTCNVAFWLAGETKRNSYPYLFLFFAKRENLCVQPFVHTFVRKGVIACTLV